MSLPKCCRLCKAPISKQTVVTRYVCGYNKTDKAFFKCLNCDVIYQYPSMSIAEEREFYKTEFEKYMANRAGKDVNWSAPDKHVESNAIHIERRMNYLKDAIVKNGTVLEIGCSSGFMLYELINNKMIPTGIEPSGVFADFVRSKGITIFDDLDVLIENKSPITFDLICHFFVLEHIRDPISFIKKTYSLLKNHGTIVFEIPCSSDPLITIYDIPAFERFYWSAAHHWYFSKKSIEYILSNLNLAFEVIPEQRYGLSNHMTWALTGLPGGANKYDTYFSKKVLKEYKKSMCENGYYDTLFVKIFK